MESKHKQPCPPPSPSPNQFTLLKDISNFKTPKRPSQNPDFSHSPFPQFFTASKQTPKSSFSSSVLRPRRSSVAASRRLKAFELEQTKSARKVQISKEKSLKSLAKSLTVWLNFLFENPRSCGCDFSKLTGEDERSEPDLDVSPGGKRDSFSRGGVGVDYLWRGPKRRRDSMWVGLESGENSSFSSSSFPRLNVSLGEICSLDDLEQRMREYLSLTSCKEIFDVMTLVTKNIDEGRLKMKAHCPLVTDVGMKEKAIRILMSYNPVWLRIGLYIVFGGDSLLPNGDVSSEQEVAFLKMVIEKQILAHAGLAKSFVYNKLVDGLYRPGYFEKLGKIILKRFLLLVIILDRAKSQSSLPINYGIDGLDGGSPLLFMLQSKIKSSRQVISAFLSLEVMHGEGNLLSHLVTVRYKVYYQQSHLSEYDFKVTDLFEDLQDGVRLCRAIQLLHHDSSILTKIVVPSDNRKKNMLNCGTALQHLKQAGVPLYDEDETMIIGEDVVSGDKELTLSLLWNMFVHLQLPLLVNRMLLSEEITKVHGYKVELSNTCTLLAMLLKWVQAICEHYDNRIDNFSSLLDGRGMWCLLDYYFRKEHHLSNSHTDTDETKGEVSIMSAADYTDAVHNFILSQKLISLLGNFPEVMQVSDILEHNGACNDRSVVILLVFLASQLIKKSMEQLNFHKLFGHNCRGPETKYFSRNQQVANDAGEGNNEDNRRNFKAIMAWWREMAQQNSKSSSKPVYPALQNFIISEKITDSGRDTAAKIIQCHFRRFVESHKYSRMKKAVNILQASVCAWMTVKNSEMIKLSTINVPESSYGKGKRSKTFCRYIAFMVDRHRFVKLKWSVLIIQRSTRAWISRKRHTDSNFMNAATVIQKYVRRSIARRLFIQRLPNLEKTSAITQENEENNLQMIAALHIQHAWRKHAAFMVDRHRFIKLKWSVLTIQRSTRNWISQKRHIDINFMNAATVIQKYVRGSIARRLFIQRLRNLEKTSTITQEDVENDLQMIAALHIQHAWRKHAVYNSLCSQHLSATKIQSYYRAWLLRRSFMNQKQAAMKIQGAYRCLISLRSFQHYKLVIRSVICVQSHVRGWLARRVAYIQRHLIVVVQSHCRGWLTRKNIFSQKGAATRLQSAFRCFRCRKAFHCNRDAAIEIQQFIRGLMARKRILEASCLREVSDYSSEVSMGSLKNLELKIYLHSVLKLQRWWRGILLLQARKKSAILIQSHVRGWLARRMAKIRRHRIAVIQAYCKGYLARKDSREKLVEIRLKVQKSAANVDDGMRLINRLVAALSELLGMKSVTGILHTCATLDTATKYSQRCCEELVNAGAIDTLLKLVSSVSRSIPDQEVLKHTLSTLRNLARHPHLTEILIDSKGSIETIIRELLRNKGDGYFIASEILLNICSHQKGINAIRRLPALVKRLHNHVEELKRKFMNEKRIGRTHISRGEQTERKLKETSEILKLVFSMC